MITVPKVKSLEGAEDHLMSLHGEAGSLHQSDEGEAVQLLHQRGGEEEEGDQIAGESLPDGDQYQDPLWSDRGQYRDHQFGEGLLPDRLSALDHRCAVLLSDDPDLSHQKGFHENG